MQWRKKRLTTSPLQRNRQQKKSKKSPLSKRATLNSDRHVPVRTCVGCRSRRPQTELIRCALVDGIIVVDRGGSGRGAWLCGRGCIDAARRRRGFDRAFRTSVSPEGIDVLEESINSDMS